MAHGYSLAQDFIERPSCALIFGLAVTILGAFGAINNWMLLRNLPTQPISVEISTVNDAYDSKKEDTFWVSLQNSKWDCESINYKSVGGDTRTEIITTDDEEHMIVLVEFSDKLTCDEILEEQPTGFLTQMSDRRLKVFSESGDFNLLRYNAPTYFFDLCAYCGRGNSTIGVLVSVAVTISGLLLYPLSLRSYYKRYPFKRKTK